MIALLVSEAEHPEDTGAMEVIVRRDCCAYCAKRNEHWRAGIGADHIEPTSKGGPNLPSNLTGCCSRCNAGKNNRPLLMFLLQRADKERAEAEAREWWPRW